MLLGEAGQPVCCQWPPARLCPDCSPPPPHTHTVPAVCAASATATRCAAWRSRAWWRSLRRRQRMWRASTWQLAGRMMRWGAREWGAGWLAGIWVLGDGCGSGRMHTPACAMPPGLPPSAGSTAQPVSSLLTLLLPRMCLQGDDLTSLVAGLHTQAGGAGSGGAPSFQKGDKVCGGHRAPAAEGRVHGA